jgi:hypothetical protein
MGPVPRPVDSEDWLAAAADTVGKVEDADNDDEEEDKARVEVTVIAAGRVDEELGAAELVDRVVWDQLHFEQVMELLTEDEDGTARALDATALEVTALLAGRAAEMSLAAEDLTTADEAAADLAELDWILDATPPTASVAAPAGVAGFVVLAAEVWRSAGTRVDTEELTAAAVAGVVAAARLLAAWIADNCSGVNRLSRACSNDFFSKLDLRFAAAARW